MLPSMRERLLAHIESHGPIPFDVFMAECLYGQGGFFATSQLRSEKAGDFLTSPEVSHHFGAAIGRWVETHRSNMGEPFSLIEIGGGSGSLLKSIATVSPRVNDVWAVEVSPAARTMLSSRTSAKVVSDLDELPIGLRGVAVANELIDNLPMAIAQMTERGWRERWVGVEGESLAFVDADPRPRVSTWLNSYAGEVDEGGWVEVQLDASRWLGDLAVHLAEGAILLIDYGDTAENLIPRRRDGTLRTYRAHHLGPHPLDEPGATDITADVNFSALIGEAQRLGLQATLHRQDDFLASLGLRAAISDLRQRELALAREGDHTQRMAIRSERSDLETLLHPRGLGDFRVLEIRVPERM